MTTIINRQHLFAQLKRDALHRVITIHAPSGYGKTILARQLVSWTGYTTVWQTVDEWQRDVSVLHDHSLLMWSQLVAGIKETNTTSNPDIWKRVELLNLNLNRFLDEPCLYIIDNVHYLADSPTAERWLQMQIDQLPETVHIVLVGQYLPDLEWTKLVGHNLVYFFREEHLRFTVPDTQKLFRLSQQEALKLVAHFNGWIAGIQLALNPESAEPAETKPYQIRSSDNVFNEMAESVFKQQPPDRQHFLLTTATLSKILPDICREALEIEDIDPHIKALLGRNMFISSDGGIYSYHELFRQYLQDYLAKNNKERFRDLHIWAAQWYAAHDEIEEAVSHYVKAEAWTEAVDLAEKLANEFYTIGRWESLLYFHSILKDHDTPLLLHYTVLILIDRNRLVEAETLLRRAETEYLLQERVEEALRAQVDLAVIYNRLGDYKKALLQTQKISEQTAIDNTLRFKAMRISAWAELELGNTDKAISEMLYIIDNYKPRNEHERSHLLQDLSSAYLRSGDFTKVASTLHEVVAIRRDLDNPSYLAHALNDLAYFYHCNSQYQLAMDTVKEGLSIVENSSERVVAALHWSLADIYRDLGQYENAEKSYFLALQIAEKGNESLHSRIMISFARMRIWEQRFGDAHLLLEESSRLLPVKQGILIQVIQIMQNFLAYVKNANGNSNPDTLIAAMESLKYQHAMLKLAQLLGFYFYIAVKKQQTKMLDHAQYLLSCLPEYLSQALAAALLNMPDLLEIAQGLGLMEYEELVKAVNKLQKLHQPRKVEDSLDSVMILDVYTLGQDYICCDGQEIPTSAWKVMRARELFYYLYFNGPQRKADLASVFWPEHSDKQIRYALQKTLRRSREAIPNVIVFENDKYQINPKLHIKCDVIRFRKYVHRAQHLNPQDVRTADLYHQALKLYNDIFLPTIYSDWARDLRDELEALYIRALLGAACCSESQNNFDDAVEFYEKAAKIDPYDDEIACLKMKSYAKLGQYAKVKQSYDELLEHLREIATIPSPETQQLYKDLLS